MSTQLFCLQIVISEMHVSEKYYIDSWTYQLNILYYNTLNTQTVHFNQFNIKSMQSKLNATFHYATGLYESLALCGFKRL